MRTVGIEEELLAGPVDDGLAALLRRGTVADLQRQVHRETSDHAAVVRAAVAVTSGSDAETAALGRTG